MEPPVLPADLIAVLEAELTAEEAPFLAHLGRELTLEWLEADSDRLGNTRFEMNHNELFKRRRLRGTPGPITIGLHPMLADDVALFRHTLVHELLHAAGLLEHTARHRKLADEIAPPPTLSNSPALRALREQVLGQSDQKEWTCGNCGFEWKRKTVRKPSRCPKCAHVF